MNLQIRDPRAHKIAAMIARRKNISMTEAVITALEAEWERAAGERTLAERLSAIADELAALGSIGGRDMTRDEIDGMWGHE